MRLLAAALAPALVLALLFGIRDALRAVRTNVFTGLPRYFWVYFAVPIVMLTGLAVVAAVVLALAALALGLTPRATGTTVAVVLAAVFLGVEVRAFLVQVRESMERAHLAPSGRRRALALLGLVLATVVACALVAVGIAAWRVSVPPSGIALIVGINLLLLPPVLRSAFRELRPAFRSTRPAARRAPTAAPSVVLISIDTLRADRLGAYGGTAGRMPALDRIAAPASCSSTRSRSRRGRFPRSRRCSRG